MEPTPQSSRNKRLLGIALIGLACLLVALELVSRLWLAVGLKVPKGDPRSAVLAYYPEMKKALDARISSRDGKFDVLILSDTAFSDAFGNPAAALQKELAATGHPSARIWNLSQPADTSRDSLNKYRWLTGKKFDWVIIYLGLNDLHAGSVPKLTFRNDYSHLPWFDEVDTVIGKPRDFPGNILASPFLWNYGRFRRHGPRAARPVLDASRLLDAQDLADGARNQSLESFRRNLKEMLKISKSRKEFMTLATYASFVDPNYRKYLFTQELTTRAAGTSGTLQLAYAAAPYAAKALPCEVWGRPDVIKQVLGTQNDEIRELVKKVRIDLADLSAQIPARGDLFVDVCHFSPAGVKELARALATHAPKKKGATPAPANPASAPATTSTQPAKPQSPSPH